MLKKCFCELVQRLKIPIWWLQEQAEETEPFRAGRDGGIWAGRKGGRALQMLDQAVDARLRSAEVTSAPINSSSAAELQEPKAQVPLSWHCLGERAWLELDPESKTPCEHFPHGSENKEERKTAQAGGCHKNLALGPKEASSTWNVTQTGWQRLWEMKTCSILPSTTIFSSTEQSPRLGEGCVRVSLPQTTCEDAVETII